MEFFIDVDRETIKRVTVEERDANRFSVVTSLLLDQGMEIQMGKAEVVGASRLQQALAGAGIAREAVEAAFGWTPHQNRRAWTLPTTALAGIAVLGGALAVCGWL